MPDLAIDRELRFLIALIVKIAFQNVIFRNHDFPDRRLLPAAID